MWIKKTEHPRTDVCKSWCWRRLLRVPWTARRSKQSILKEINPEYSLEGLMLKLQHFGHLMWRADSLEKTRCWEREGKRIRGRPRMRWLDGHHWLNGHKFEQTPGDSEGQGNPGMLQSMWSQRVQYDIATEQQQHQKLRYLDYVTSEVFSSVNTLWF